MRFAPSLPSEKDLRDRFATLGIAADGSFNADKLTPEIRKAVEAGMADAWAELATFKKDKVDTGQVTSGQVFGTREQLNGNYLYRMAGAVLGIYGNSSSEAMYPVLSTDSDGAPLTGANNYTLTFAPGPVAAGQRVLVGDDVQAPREPAGGQPDQPLSDQLADAPRPRQEPRRQPDHLHPEHLARTGEGSQLAARPGRTVHPRTCGCTRPSRTPSMAPGSRRNW